MQPTMLSTRGSALDTKWGMRTSLMQKSAAMSTYIVKLSDDVDHTVTDL